MFCGKLSLIELIMSKLEFHISHSLILSQDGAVRHLGSNQFLHGRGQDVTLAFYMFLSNDSPLPKLARLYLYQVHGE